MQTKINIIRTEARRRLNNCKYTTNAYKHLDVLKLNLLDSGYPSHIIDEYIMKEIHRWLSPPNNTVKEKPNYEFILKIPFCNENYTRVIKNM